MRGKNMIKEPVIQQIDGKEQKKWSFNELRDSLVCNESVNEWYLNHWDNFVYNPKNLKNKEKWAEDETWRQVKYYNGVAKYSQYDIWASNYGRIARRIGENEYKILTDYYEKIIEKPLNKNLLKNHKTRNKVGYLKIVGLRPSVYQMVADAWLKGYTFDKTNKHIHHITNDGYDNRPENLIILDDYTHRELHSGRLNLKYKPGTSKKNLGPA